MSKLFSLHPDAQARMDMLRKHLTGATGTAGRSGTSAAEASEASAEAARQTAGEDQGLADKPK